MNLNYGIELEFFVKESKTDKIIPAYKATNNLDGNPVIGEIKTNIHNNIIDCIFELKKLLYIQKTSLERQGFELCIINEITVDNDFLKNLRQDQYYVNNKELEILKEFSIYNNKTGKILPRNKYKASLQLNISCNKSFTITKYNKITIEDKSKYEESYEDKKYSNVFNYVDIIKKLDNIFKQEITDSKRVKGVYAIKNGELGDRVEYRSLPNTIALDKLLNI